EVAAGVVTRVNFEAVELYGAAGQVTYQDGTPAKGMPVYAYNNDGDKVSSSLTDLFGYFRVDSLPPGDYRLNVETGDVTPAPSVMITISDDYLFDRNIVLPFKSQPVGE
ncbi:MAG: carboxypeptidase-like regulatory domain-containing protein, partial [Nitrospinota bacterium]|nr:carboxypeptidase-like regulatory domain-containing protein [Nitrospinota bacterium]